MSEHVPSPLVVVPCDTRAVKTHVFHMVGEKYIDAVRDTAGCTPVLLPATNTPLPVEDVLTWAKGHFHSRRHLKCLPAALRLT